MEANELRIGNCVNEWSCTDKKYYVKKLDIDLLRCIIEDWTECEPIQLTEEWLLKFGFDEEIKEGNHSDFWVYKNGDLTFNSSHGWWYINQPLKTRPKHVHQLQNLYFALTGEELTIKE